MVGVARVAEKAATVLFGGIAVPLISTAALISTLRSLNGCILAGPKVYYAMARDKLFFKRVADIHPRFRTPGFSIFIQAVWSSLLTLSGTYEQIFTYVVFAALIFYIAATASVFTPRKNTPIFLDHIKPGGIPHYP